MASAVAAYVASAYAGVTVASFSAALGSTAVVYAVAYVAAAAATSYAISAAAQSLARQQAPPNLGGLGGSLPVTGKSPVGSARIIYGSRRVKGQLVFAGAFQPTGQVVYSESHTVPPTLQISVDRTVWFDADIGVSRYEPQPDNTTYEAVGFTAVGGSPGLNQYVVDRGVYTFSAANVGHIVQIVYHGLGNVGVANQSINLVIILASHECNAINGIFFGNEEVPLDGSGNCVVGRYAGRVRVKKYLGTTTQAADSQLTTESQGQWTSAHRLLGHAYIYVRIFGGAGLFPSGIPDISADVDGRNDIYDPRGPSTGFSRNAALIAANYICSADGMACDYATEINEASLIAEANVCDENVDILPAGTEKRYWCDCVLDTAVSVESNLRDILTAMGGSAIWSAGRWIFRSARFVSPTVSLDESDFRGSLQVIPAPSRRTKFNAVKGAFVGPWFFWQPASYPEVRNAAAEAADGELIYQDINFPATTSVAAVQRLAKIELLRHRNGLTVKIPCRLSAAALAVGDTVQISDAVLGWSSKIFEVTGWEFALYDDAQGAPALGVDLTLQETLSTIFVWGTSDETLADASPNTTLPAPFIVPAVTNLTAASGEDQAVIGSDGQVTARMLISWTVPDGAYISRGRIEVDAGPVNVPFPFSRAIEGAAAALSGYVQPIAVGTTYKIRARFINELGYIGPWGAIIQHTAASVTVPPADVLSFFIAGARLTWAAVVDAALAGYRIRYHAGNNTSWGNATGLHSGLLTSSPWSLDGAPAGLTTLMIKAVDRLGNESTNPAVIVANLNDAIVANVLVVVDFDALGYPGALVGGTRSGGDLIADTSGLLWDTNASRSMWTSDGALQWLSSYVAMTYTDAVVVSAGESGASLTLAVVATGDSVVIEYRPQGPALVWSAVPADPMWTSDAAAVWTLPSFQPWPGRVVVEPDIYDLRVTTGFGAAAGTISNFAATLDVDDVNETIADAVIASGGSRLVLVESYTVIKNVQLTLQTAGSAAVTAKVLDKSATLGPLVRCYDSAGAGVAGNVDATIQGY